MKIKEANAEYTGGNIWLFYGELTDGNFFLTDDYGWTLILNANPSNFDESTYVEWQQEHLVKELEGNDRLEFCNQLLNWLSKHIDNCNGMTDSEIEAYRNYFKIEY